MRNITFISLGSNIGNRANQLMLVIMDIIKCENIELMTSSSIYETNPVGYEKQDKFLNMVIKVSTSFTPIEILRFLQQLENFHGRKREIRWGPRTIDLDILLFNNENIETEDLIVPHPRMSSRAFVLIPLYEIEPNLTIPNNAKPLSLLVKELIDGEGVRIWKQINGEGELELFES